ncbi:hypothetical protein [Methylobacterium thuringiense]|uniref:hypothetical protein n=1 Tax=Methylobacterium thuringiense TaxID=1003091 RepID=UPI001EE062BF|nr:hypothetical protein [Methylobacterium thuringiense]
MIRERGSHSPSSGDAQRETASWIDPGIGRLRFGSIQGLPALAITPRRMLSRHGGHTAVIRKSCPLQRVRPGEDQRGTEGQGADADQIAAQRGVGRHAHRDVEIAALVTNSGKDRQSPTPGQVLAGSAKEGIGSGLTTKSRVIVDEGRLPLAIVVGIASLTIDGDFDESPEIDQVGVEPLEGLDQTVLIEQRRHRVVAPDDRPAKSLFRG